MSPADYMDLVERKARTCSGPNRWPCSPTATEQERYSGRPDVLGENLRLDGVEHTIIGVAHPDLEFASFKRAQVLTPLVMNRSGANRSVRYLFVSGRPAEGVTHAMASAELRAIGERLAAEHRKTTPGGASGPRPFSSR